MTDRVYLHVGSPKSGTTYLQRILRHNQQTLGRQGVLVAGRTHTELVHAGFVVRDDRRLQGLPARAAGAWDRIVAEVAAFSGESAVISYELLAGATRKQARRAVESLAGPEVHVVVTTRDLGRMVSSAWQERLKFGLTDPLEDWRPRPESAGPRAEWGWRTLDPASVAGRWAAAVPAERVHIVTAPRVRSSPTALWDRFAEACSMTGIRLDLDVPVANESLGNKAAEVLRRVNEQDLGPIQGAREQARWLRDTLAHRVLADLDDEPMTITDDQLAEAQERAAAAVARIRAEGWQVHGDLDDLDASRQEGRPSRELPAEEVLEVATQAIVALLLELRAARTEPTGAAPTMRAASPGGWRRETQSLAERLATIEADIGADRALHERVAVLTDLVQELLVPTADDPSGLRQALRRYRRTSL